MHGASFARPPRGSRLLAYIPVLSPVRLAQWTVLRLLRAEKILDADVVDSTRTTMVGASLTLYQAVRLTACNVKRNT